jgi:hypothetical protein
MSVFLLAIVSSFWHAGREGTRDYCSRIYFLRCSLFVNLEVSFGRLLQKGLVIEVFFYLYGPRPRDGLDTFNIQWE